jgi:DNA-binding response OmpR family regulator
VDVQATQRGKAGTSPQDEARGGFAFAGLVLDLDACTLKREAGEAIALTRAEFALLREFVRRPGRVLSRDFLLDAAFGRRNAPFDRSVDVMVGRLRKKVEPDPNNRALSRPFRAKATASARCSADVNRPPKLSPLRPPARRGTRLSHRQPWVPWT